ncbi:MAG: N-formylglutamate amidohydrolase [Chlamydiia bacterium]|nr:N-formylglutamate amidohydrolase [Chlamydiia bacterium]
MPARRTPVSPLNLLLSCEHGGNKVPKKYAPLFRGADAALCSHRGYDPGALKLARHLAKNFGAPLIYEEVTRLLIEMNRTLRSPTLFSEFTKELPEAEKKELIARYHAPYRARILETLKTPALHFSVHSFTPVFNGVRRTLDIGLLYDPGRSLEKRIAKQLKEHLSPRFTVRMNQPYKGIADGLTKELRRKFPDTLYAGIELEVNQSIVSDIEVLRALEKALKEVILGQY